MLPDCGKSFGWVVNGQSAYLNGRFLRLNEHPPSLNRFGSWMKKIDKCFCEKLNYLTVRDLYKI